MRYRVIIPYSDPMVRVLQLSDYAPDSKWTTTAIGTPEEIQTKLHVLRNLQHGFQSFEEGWL